MRRIVALCFALALTSCSLTRYYVEAKIDAPPSRFRATKDSTVDIVMPDGAKLNGMLFLPQTEEKLATILVRLPLPDTASSNRLACAIGELWATRGYAVLIQGVRGRFRSQGEFEPFEHERSASLVKLRDLTDATTARQRIYLRASFPSHVVLPFIGKARA